MKDKTYYTEDLVKGAIEELEERLKEEDIKVEYSGAYDTDDLITEVADNNIPIYTYDLLQYASNNFDLIEPSELASDNPSVISIITANIFELLANELHEYIQDDKLIDLVVENRKQGE